MTLVVLIRVVRKVRTPRSQPKVSIHGLASLQIANFVDVTTRFPNEMTNQETTWARYPFRRLVERPTRLNE